VSHAKPRRPTEAELEILRVLWDRGPSTVREVHASLAAAPDSRQSGYTTVLKHMQIMLEKGLLARETDRRPQVYRPTHSQGSTQRQLLSHLIDKAFSGSPRNLVLNALGADRASPDELAAIESLLSRLEAERDDSSTEEPS